MTSHTHWCGRSLFDPGHSGKGCGRLWTIQSGGSLSQRQVGESGLLISLKQEKRALMNNQCAQMIGNPPQR